MENGQVVDQNLHPALELIASQPALFQGQRSVVAGWRRYRGRRLGPYYRLVYRHRGRQCSVYLGRSGELRRWSFPEITDPRDAQKAIRSAVGMTEQGASR